MQDYIYSLMNPLFLLFDYIYEFNFFKYSKFEPKVDKYEYDFDEDKIIITYFSNDRKYILKVDRKIDIDLKELVRHLKNIEHDDAILGAQFNGQDILDQTLMYFGPSLMHNDYHKLKVKDILNECQRNNFQNFVIMNNMCETFEFNSLEQVITL